MSRYQGSNLEMIAHAIRGLDETMQTIADLLATRVAEVPGEDEGDS